MILGVQIDQSSVYQDHKGDPFFICKGSNEKLFAAYLDGGRVIELLWPNIGFKGRSAFFRDTHILKIANSLAEYFSAKTNGS